MTPVEVLTKELNIFEKALKKSAQAHKEGKIDIGLHQSHIRNLTPKIEEFKKAIKILIEHYGEY